MKWIALVLSLFVFQSCQNSPEKVLLSKIKELEINKKMLSSDTLINLYLEFVKEFPKHEYAVKYLFKAGEASVKAGKKVEAAKIYERVDTEYNDKELSPEALIRAAVCLQSVPDPANAKRLFEVFLEKYPQHERYQDVKAMNEIVGLTEEELLKRFSEKFEAIEEN
jgi:tetratricopeptide (TPR) repeat protein